MKPERAWGMGDGKRRLKKVRGSRRILFVSVTVLAQAEPRAGASCEAPNHLHSV